MLCYSVKDEERNRQIKRILVQNDKSPHSGYLEIVEEDEGEVEKESYPGEGPLELNKWKHVL